MEPKPPHDPTPDRPEPENVQPDNTPGLLPPPPPPTRPWMPLGAPPPGVHPPPGSPGQLPGGAGRPIFGTAVEERADPRTILAAVLPTIVAFGGISALGGFDPGTLILLMVFAGINAAIQAVQWSHRWYSVSDTELRMRWGVLSRDQRVVPFSRIQQVEHRQRLTHQILGLAVLQIETAADAGQTTVAVDALPLAEAERLRTFLLERRHAAATAQAPGTAPPPSTPQAPGAPPTSLWGDAAGDALLADAANAGSSPAGAPGTPYLVGPGPSAPETVLQLTDSRLALAGATGAGVLGALVVLFWPIGLLLDSGFVSEEQVAEITGEAATAAGTNLTLVALLVLGILVVMPIAAGVLSIVQWHGYQLAASEDDILVRHGLFEVRRLSMPRRRVQVVTIADNPIRRRLGYVSVRLQSAAGGAGGSNVLLIPLVPTAEVEALLVALLHDDKWQPSAVRRRPPAALRRAIIRRTAAMVVLVSPLVVAVAPIGLLALVLVPLGIPWGRAAHQRAGFARTEETATLAKGVLVHTQSVVELHRLQSARTTTSPLQRRSRLASLHLDIAGGGSVTLGDLDGALATTERRGLLQRA